MFGVADSEDSGGVIRLRIKNTAQLFNSLDPAPFIERDLNNDAVAWIVSWAGVLHEKAQLELHVELSEPRAGIEHHAVIAAGVKNHFGTMALLAKNELRQLMRVGRLSLIIGLTVLIGAFALGQAVVELFDASPATELLREGFSIGGWVAMWRPLEIMLLSLIHI